MGIEAGLVAGPVFFTPGLIYNRIAFSPCKTGLAHYYFFIFASSNQQPVAKPVPTFAEYAQNAQVRS